jgi:phage regulator Rha-like protein
MYLVMGFTEKAAAQWKEKFIEAFNTMEQILKNAVPDPRTLSRMDLIQIAYEAKQEAIALRAENSAQTQQIRDLGHPPTALGG